MARAVQRRRRDRHEAASLRSVLSRVLFLSVVADGEHAAVLVGVLGEVELVENVADVLGDGGFGGDEHGGDGGVREALGRKGEGLVLTREYQHGH
jgi:hypothetical protein